jgi:hypothetical protein
MDIQVEKQFFLDKLLIHIVSHSVLEQYNPILINSMKMVELLNMELDFIDIMTI